MPQKINWQAVDWSKTNAVLAQDLSLSVPTISNRRRRFAPQTVRTHTDWSQADWTKRNCELAAEFSATPRAVAAARWRLAPATQRKRTADVPWHVINWTLSTGEIAKALGVPVSTVSRARKERVRTPIARLSEELGLPPAKLHGALRRCGLTLI